MPLCAARPGSGASWGTDKTIVFGGGPGGGLARISQDGGEPVVLTAPPAGSPEVSYGWPDVLPGGFQVLYTAVSLASSRVALFDVSTGLSYPVVDSAAFGRYSPTGHVVFERRGRLEAAPFSLRERRLTGAASTHSSRARDRRRNRGRASLRFFAHWFAHLRARQFI